jgi:hypothetical protein
MIFIYIGQSWFNDSLGRAKVEILILLFTLVRTGELAGSSKVNCCSTYVRAEVF